MAGTAVLGRLTWLVGEVTETVTETPRVRTLVLDVPGWTGHRAGQHVDVRLTAEDGYQAERSYSLASAPGEPPALTVERLDDGELSPYLVDEVVRGDRFELRGPIGGYFVWDHDGSTEPLFLVAGGSGVVPLMAMLRHRRAVGSTVPAKLLYSSRSLDDVIYRDELDRLGAEVVQTLTREQPPGWGGYGRRVDVDMLREVSYPPDESPRVFVCGPTNFVEAVAEGLVALGHRPGRIRTERFGGT
ncbi:MAG: oxidoreductase [Actinobacteria bacterium]|nr:MAG: oxidoreductase [Actinomycetota bacterium]